MIRHALAAALLLAPLPTFAQDTAAAVTPSMPAPPPASAMIPDSPEVKAQKQLLAKQLIKLLRPVWNDDQIGRIMLIGWYSGAAAMCDDLELDQAKLARAIAAVAATETGKLPADRRKFLADNLTMGIGMATGVMMGSHSREVPAYCAEAHAAMSELPADKHLFQVTATN